MKIKEFILRVGIKSQEELAERLGVKPETVYAWTAGARKPTHETIVALYELGMTTEEIFGKPYPSSARSASEMDAAVAEVFKRLVNNIGKI